MENHGFWQFLDTFFGDYAHHSWILLFIYHLFFVNITFNKQFLHAPPVAVLATDADVGAARRTIVADAAAFLIAPLPRRQRRRDRF